MYYCFTVVLPCPVDGTAQRMRSDLPEYTYITWYIWALIMLKSSAVSYRTAAYVPFERGSFTTYIIVLCIHHSCERMEELLRKNSGEDQSYTLAPGREREEHACSGSSTKNIYGVENAQWNWEFEIANTCQRHLFYQITWTYQIQYES